MNRFPPSLDTDSPHSLHSPFLHFDLITSPSPSFLSYFSFFFHFINDPPRFPSLDSWPLLDSASFYPVFVLWKNWTLGIAGPLRERAIFGTLANLETHFSSTRDALLTHRIYTIKSFVLLHTCFPRITRSLSLSISKGSSLFKGGNFIRWFSWMNETCLEQSSGIEYSTSIHPPFHYAFEGEFLRSTKSKKKKRKSHLYGTKTFLFIENIHRTFERLKCSRKMAEKSHLYFINKSR